MNADTISFIEELFSKNDLNRLPASYGGGRIFATPLIGVSRGDDLIFNKFKEVVAAEHLTPLEMWLKSGLTAEKSLNRRLRILSIIFPYVDRIREESKYVTDMPAEIYSLGRNYANEFMEDVLKQTVIFFQDRGFRATAGMLSPAFQIMVRENPFRVYSAWLERHIAFAAGLGTFSLHEGLITEAGCNIRVTSVITDAPLQATPRKSDQPYANCLYYAQKKCRKCEERCPANAINKDGHDKLKCDLYGRVVEKEMTQRLRKLLKPHYYRIDGKDNWVYPVGCAFCQFGVPCTSKNPMVKLQRPAIEDSA